MAPSDEEEWQDLSPSHRPKVKPPASRLKLEIPAKESAKVVELGTTGEIHTAEQDGTIHVPQSTQQAPDRVRVQPPTEEEQRVVSKEDASSEMMAMASGPRPVEALASSAVNHRGVPSLSPVTPRRRERRIWAAGTPASNQGDASSGEPESKAVTTIVLDTPSDTAPVCDEQLSLLMAAMEESRQREERMTLKLHEMQQQLSANETQQELLSQKAQKDQQDLQQANAKLVESLRLERDRTAAMLTEPSPKGRQDVVIYVTNSEKTVQLNLRLSLRDSVDTVYTQCKEISTQKGIPWPKDGEYELWLTGRNQQPVSIIAKDVPLLNQGIRAEDLLMATLKSDRPEDISRANTPEGYSSLRGQRLMPITTVWGVTIKVWPANNGNAIMFRECTIPMDATWREVKRSHSKTA